ncbi:MAG: PdxA family protein [Halorhabdus sp.]
MTREQPVIGVTMGDPAGIGPEITLAAVADPDVRETVTPVVFGDADHLDAVADRHGIDVNLRRITDVEGTTADGWVDVVDFDNVEQDVTYGEVRRKYGRASLAYVDHTVDLAVQGGVDGVANAPIHKEAIARAGSDHAGHTDLIAAQTDTKRCTALITDGDLRVTHHSLHVPLPTAIDRVTTDRLLETIQLTADLLPEVGVVDPKLGVLGLNPHAGDGGVIGDIDDEIVRPAIERARETGIDAHGPLPPDSSFNRALDDEFDCLVALYHDQGHIPVFVNSHVAGGGVRATALTLGLPFPRATTLHGTAYDIAGEGVASPDSMIASIEAVADVARESE